MKFNKKKQKDHSEPETGHEPEIEDISIYMNEMVEDFLVRTRRLLLVGEITEITSANICSYLQFFSLKKEPVYLYINSHGGCLSSGYAIIDQMLACCCPIHTIIRGQAYSMGAMIAAFGKKGHRYSMPNASIMLHSIIVQNPPESISRHTEMMTFVEEDYCRKVTDLAKRLKLTTKQLAELMNKTGWMSPKQAIEIGLIDGIWTSRMEQAVNKGFTR